jgi:hypothetical protein
MSDEPASLGDALNIVKIQVQQMKRHLVCSRSSTYKLSERWLTQTCNIDWCVLMVKFAGDGSAYGCTEERQFNVGRTTHVLAITQAIL